MANTAKNNTAGETKKPPPLLISRDRVFQDSTHQCSSWSPLVFTPMMSRASYRIGQALIHILMRDDDAVPRGQARLGLRSTRECEANRSPSDVRRATSA